MNYVCPLCNLLKKIQVICEQCQEPMEDCGKAIDYFDQYSAYENISTLKLADGDIESLKNNTCLHLFFCSACFVEKTIPVQEERT